MDEESSSEGEGGSHVEEGEVERKVLPQRTTRGTRKGKMVGQTAEADEEFWGQSAFKEDESDEEFEETSGSGSGSDDTETDSDIDAPEPEDEGVVGDGGGGGGGGGGGRGREEEDEGGGRKKGKAGGGKGYMDPALKASAAWGGTLGSIAAAAAAKVAAAEAKTSRAAAAASAAAAAAPGDLGDATGAGGASPMIAPLTRPKRGSTHPHTGDSSGAMMEDGGEGGGGGGAQRSFRASTQSRSGESKASQAASASAGEARASHGGGGGGGGGHAPPKPTQSEVLTEAAHTAIENLRLLEGQLKIEQARAEREAAEAAAGRGKGHTFPPDLPIVRFHSRRGASDTLTFTCVDAVPPLGVGPSASPPKPLDKRCPVSGKVAKYFDPLTRHYYHSLVEFKVLRKAEAAGVLGVGAAK